MKTIPEQSFEHSLILLRGLPGSGKTTLAAILSEAGKYPVHSVDSYFEREDTREYLFDYRENHLAYKQCTEQTRRSMELGCTKIIIDNTFTLDWEIAPYFKLAHDFQYRVFVLTVENYHGGENIHGVSQAQLQKMAEKYKVRLL